MKTIERILSAIFLLATAMPMWGAERFPWRDDLEEARAVARAEDKPLLIVFRCEP